MTRTQFGREPNSDGGLHWLTTAASLTVGTGFLALWFWLVPPWLSFQFEIAGVEQWRWVGALPAAVGFAVALKCIWDFGWAGRGTPAPFAPPQRLVAVGPYRYVRNPMYLGFFTGWIGLWLIFGHANLGALMGALIVIGGVALFVRLYEEPTLKGKFDGEYEEYCRNVRRWLPRARAWVK
jgi:protein-S-isoprenylcysteine O-methyltransferase Ste14